MSVKKLNEKLRFLRENCGFTQEQIAKALNLDRSTYAYYEAGKTRPSIETLIKLANLFHADISDLLYRETMTLERRAASEPVSPQKTDRKTAQKAMGIPDHIYELEKDEHQLLAYFRLLSAEEKKLLLDALQPSSEKMKAASETDSFLTIPEEETIL